MSGSTQADPRGRSLEMALRALGVRCTVEAKGNLALVIPAPDERALEDAGVRRAVLAVLRTHGFSHAAVELCDERDPTSTRGAPHA